MNENTTRYQKRLRNVLRHIEDTLDEPPSLNELSRIACFSPYHFHRIFTAATGETVAAYVRRLLLQRAAQQILITEASITELALGAGYDSLDAFTRAFRQTFAMTPSAYRKTAGGGIFDNERNRKVVFVPVNQSENGIMDVKIKKFPPRLAATMRHVGSYFECGPAWDRLCSAMSACGLMNESTIALSMCWDTPDITPPEKCRMDLFFTLPDGMSEKNPEVQDLLQREGIYLQIIGSNALEYGSMTVKGPYSLLLDAYRALYGQWLPQSGREPADTPSMEIYHNTPDRTPPEELLTEIMLPLLPKR